MSSQTAGQAPPRHCWPCCFAFKTGKIYVKMFWVMYDLTPFWETHLSNFWTRINEHRVLSCGFRWSCTSLIVSYLSESRPRDLLTWTLRCYADARMRLARVAACTGLLFLHLQRPEACGHVFRLLIANLTQIWMSLYVVFEDGYSMALYKK